MLVKEKDLKDNTLLEENIDNSITSSEALENIYDSGKRKSIDEKFRALMIEKDAIRFNNLQFLNLFIIGYFQMERNMIGNG